ncbi:MAG: trypsin-like peptidase domain-containing protein [Candidatus Obscuribacterales bacterium]|nr:trypsin-like peptidase domain-containing protein [Candidatus Obscuribacterales bacterium]
MNLSNQVKSLAILLTLALGAACPSSTAVETWEKLDKRLKGQVLNVRPGLKLRLRDQYWCYVSDLSPKYRFPVYCVLKDDTRGFQIMGYGTAFPIKTAARDKTYYVTDRHVAGDTCGPVAAECARFFAATRLYAEQTAFLKDHEARFNELLQTINLSIKPGLAGGERNHYQNTVDAIWECYEKNLSLRADPSRVRFLKYAQMARVNPIIGYFLHPAGPATIPAIEATLYKEGGDGDPDIAILTAPGVHPMPLEFDPLPASEGQEIQVVGYPVASDQLDKDSEKYYAPTFTTGRVSRVTPNTVQVDAPVTSGSSGSPVVSVRGKVVAVVAQRAKTKSGAELTNFAGAISASAVKTVAPELFGK